ncbi:MAG: energy transducer TonB [Candidatus Eiseniibacteriota bacterium]
MRLETVRLAAAGSPWTGTVNARIAADLAATRTRTRWCMTWSMAAHALLLLLLFLAPKALPQAPALTEITLLDPGELAAGSEAPSARIEAAASTEGALTAGDRDEMFRRTLPRADVEPDPQNDEVLNDRLASRLATLQSDASSKVVGAAESRTNGLWGGAANAPSAEPGGGAGRSVSLNRGGGLAPAPSLALTRGGGGTAPAPALVATNPSGERSATQAPATAGEATARRSLSGAALAGPIADRAVMSYRKPVYPEWAKKDLVEGSVTLYFVVRADGSIKENVLVQRTAGFEDFDESARVALRAWRFAPLTGGRTGEQWGTITFHFKIEGAG